MIVVGVHMSVDLEKIESYFSDHSPFQTFVHGRTTHRIYRLAVSLLSTETLFLLSKLRIFLFNTHLSLQRMT